MTPTSPKEDHQREPRQSGLVKPTPDLAKQLTPHIEDWHRASPCQTVSSSRPDHRRRFTNTQQQGSNFTGDDQHKDRSDTPQRQIKHTKTRADYQALAATKTSLILAGVIAQA
jgi:hypothetical protein